LRFNPPLFTQFHRQHISIVHLPSTYTSGLAQRHIVFIDFIAIMSLAAASDGSFPGAHLGLVPTPGNEASNEPTIRSSSRQISRRGRRDSCRYAHSSSSTLRCSFSSSVLRKIVFVLQSSAGSDTSRLFGRCIQPSATNVLDSRPAKEEDDGTNQGKRTPLRLRTQTSLCRSFLIFPRVPVERSDSCLL
jgi:hypothetical protein